MRTDDLIAMLSTNVEPVDRRLEFHDAEWRARADQGFLPQAAMQIHFTRMRFVVAGPLNAAHLFQATVTHAAVHGAQRA
jgi:hypothetical protein